MSRFDDILDDVIDKARIAADVAGKKTTEVVEYGKLKYKAKTVAWDIEKAYAKLGALVYEARKSEENYEDAVMLAMEELDKLNAKLDALEDQIAKMKTDNVREVRTEKPKEAAPESGEPTEVFDYTDEE